MVSFQCEMNKLKHFLEAVICKGVAEEGEIDLLTNECILNVQDGKVEAKTLDSVGSAYINVVLKNVTILEEGTIPIPLIKQLKDGNRVGVLDGVESFGPKEQITITLNKDGAIILQGEKDIWTFETIEETKIEYALDEYIVIFDKFPKGKNTQGKTFVWKDKAIVDENVLKKIATIAKKVGRSDRAVIITARLSPEGLFLTTGTTITYKSQVTDKVETERTVTSVFQHGIGNVFFNVSKCEIFMGEDTNGFVHMWVHSENDFLVQDYLIPRQP